jgi:hypothetical protein
MQTKTNLPSVAVTGQLRQSVQHSDSKVNGRPQFQARADRLFVSRLMLPTKQVLCSSGTSWPAAANRQP